MSALPPSPPPDPMRPIQLPADQYLHPSAPTEWWWHTGTLKAGARTFGFEINAAAFGQALFSQVMLTDVQNQMHYRQTATYQFNANWAEQDATKDWYVSLPYASNPGIVPSTPPYVMMNAPASDPARNMKVQAAIVDETTKKKMTFDLTLSQEGPPFLVWGTGIQPSAPGGLQANNFYYSLTRLQASGSVSIDGTPCAVEGVTWMDHEYGYFGSAANPVNWILQDMQLDNGVCISNYATIADGQPPIMLNQPSAGQATVQFADGTTYFVRTFFTPRGKTWLSTETKKLYYLEFQVDIPSFNASIVVTSLLENQEFVSSIKIPIVGEIVIAEVYEGVATATGQFMGRPVNGTAWIEEKLP